MKEPRATAMRAGRLVGILVLKGMLELFALKMELEGPE